MIGETRVVNPTTGGEKGSKLARFDLIPPRAVIALAEHFGRGAEKYADRNWEKGVDWSLNFAAMQRHAWQWWNGDDLDEDGNSHLAAVLWHAATLIEFAHTHPELDDRPPPPKPVQAESVHEAWTMAEREFVDRDNTGIHTYNSGYDDGYEQAVLDANLTQKWQVDPGAVAVEHIERPAWCDEVTLVQSVVPKDELLASRS